MKLKSQWISESNPRNMVHSWYCGWSPPLPSKFPSKLAWIYTRFQSRQQHTWKRPETSLKIRHHHGPKRPVKSVYRGFIEKLCLGTRQTSNRPLISVSNLISTNQGREGLGCLENRIRRVTLLGQLANLFSDRQYSHIVLRGGTCSRSKCNVIEAMIYAIN